MKMDGLSGWPGVGNPEDGAYTTHHLVSSTGDNHGSEGEDNFSPLHRASQSSFLLPTERSAHPSHRPLSPSMGGCRSSEQCRVGMTSPNGGHLSFSSSSSRNANHPISDNNNSISILSTKSSQSPPPISLASCASVEMNTEEAQKHKLIEMGRPDARSLDRNCKIRVSKFLHPREGKEEISICGDRVVDVLRCPTSSSCVCARHRHEPTKSLNDVAGGKNTFDVSCPNGRPAGCCHLSSERQQHVAPRLASSSSYFSNITYLRPSFMSAVPSPAPLPWAPPYFSSQFSSPSCATSAVMSEAMRASSTFQFFPLAKIESMIEPNEEFVLEVQKQDSVSTRARTCHRTIRQEIHPMQPPCAHDHFGSNGINESSMHTTTPKEEPYTVRHIPRSSVLINSHQQQRGYVRPEESPSGSGGQDSYSERNVQRDSRVRPGCRKQNWSTCLSSKKVTWPTNRRATKSLGSGRLKKDVRRRRTQDRIPSSSSRRSARNYMRGRSLNVVHAVSRKSAEHYSRSDRQGRAKREGQSVPVFPYGYSAHPPRHLHEGYGRYNRQRIKLCARDYPRRVPIVERSRSRVTRPEFRKNGRHKAEEIPWFEKIPSSVNSSRRRGSLLSMRSGKQKKRSRRREESSFHQIQNCYLSPWNRREMPSNSRKLHDDLSFEQFSTRLEKDDRYLTRRQDRSRRLCYAEDRDDFDRKFRHSFKSYRGKSSESWRSSYRRPSPPFERYRSSPYYRKFRRGFRSSLNWNSTPRRHESQLRRRRGKKRKQDSWRTPRRSRCESTSSYPPEDYVKYSQRLMNRKPMSCEAKRTSVGSMKASGGGDDDIIHFEWYEGLPLKSNLTVRGQLGEGTFGRVLDCYDSVRDRRTAVKVIRDVERYTSAAQIESDILHEVNRADPLHQSHCVLLYESFMYKRHMCLSFEVLGPSLYDFLSRNNFRGFYVEDIRVIARQCLEALAFLRKINLTHTDLKPENILFVDPAYSWQPFYRSVFQTANGKAMVNERSGSKLPSSSSSCDMPNSHYGNAKNMHEDSDDANNSIDCVEKEKYTSKVTSSYELFTAHQIQPPCFASSPSCLEESMNELSSEGVALPFTVATSKRPRRSDVRLIDFGSATFENEEKSSVINTRQYRAPEVILDIGWSMESDVWSLGCILMELYTGCLLFKTHEHLEHLAMMEKSLGPFPQSMLLRILQQQKCDGRKYITVREGHRVGINWPEGASSSKSLRKVERYGPLEQFVLPRHRLFADFVTHLLQLDPALRPTPLEALRHPFFDPMLNGILE